MKLNKIREVSWAVIINVMVLWNGRSCSLFACYEPVRRIHTFLFRAEVRRMAMYVCNKSKRGLGPGVRAYKLTPFQYHDDKSKRSLGKVVRVY